MSISVTWHSAGDIRIAELEGRIDSGNASHLAELLDEGIGVGGQSLILDFAGVSYISSAGLRLCLILAKRLSGPQERFAICALSDYIREIVATSGFDTLMPVHDTRDDAIQGLQG